MSITIPTSAKIGAVMRQAAHYCAIAIAIAIAIAHVTYQAGYRFGQFIHWMNDWLADASHHPGQSASRLAMRLVAWSDKILAPSAGPLLAEGAIILTDEQLEVEISAFEKKQPVARRKPAKARKVKAAA